MPGLKGPAYKGQIHDKAIQHLALAVVVIAMPATAAAQGDAGPRVEKTYGEGLPRDRGRILFEDSQYPTWPLTDSQKPYAVIDGARMKRHVVNLAQIALRDRDAGHKWWGRLPGTAADREGMAYMTRRVRAARPEGRALSVRAARGLAADRFRRELSRRLTERRSRSTTVFPVADTKPTGPQGVTAEAVWVGIGSGADFIGRDVKGKAVVIYSTFVPGGRSHSASDRAGLFNANTRAVKARRRGRRQRDGGSRQRPVSARRRAAAVPHFTLSQDEGFALQRPARQRREGSR